MLGYRNIIEHLYRNNNNNNNHQIVDYYQNDFMKFTEHLANVRFQLMPPISGFQLNYQNGFLEFSTLTETNDDIEALKRGQNLTLSGNKN